MTKSKKRSEPKDPDIKITVGGKRMTVDEFLQYQKAHSPSVPSVTIIDQGKGMTIDEFLRHVKASPSARYDAELVNELAQVIADRTGIDPRKIAPRLRISVSFDAKTIELDRKIYAGIDLVHLLIVDELIKARGNWMTREEMKEAQPKLKMEKRLDLTIKKFRKTYPEIGSRIEVTHRGYRLDPSLFS